MSDKRDAERYRFLKQKGHWEHPSVEGEKHSWFMRLFWGPDEKIYGKSLDELIDQKIKDQIEKMIKEKQEKYAWQFVFLSADLAAIGEALASGMPAASVMAHDKDGQGTHAAWASLSRSIADYRSGNKEDVSFTEEDRAKQKIEKKRK